MIFGDGIWTSNTQNQILVSGCAWNGNNAGGSFAWTSYSPFGGIRQYYIIRLII